MPCRSPSVCTVSSTFSPAPSARDCPPPKVHQTRGAGPIFGFQILTQLLLPVRREFLKLGLQFGHLAFKPCPVSLRRRLIFRLARTLRHTARLAHSTPPGALPP